MNGYIYLIGSKTFSWYKIGKSRTPHVRVKDLGVLLPFKIEVIAVWKTNVYSQLEKLLHEKFAANRINGEWFWFTERQIEEVLAAMGWFTKVDSFVNFKNLEKDGPEGRIVKVKFKLDFTDEERARRKQESIAEQQSREKHDCPICGISHRTKRVSASGQGVSGTESRINTVKPSIQ